MSDTNDFASVWRAAAEHAIAYRQSIAARPQRPESGYAQLQAAFADATPQAGAAMDIVISDLVARAGPGLHAKTGPRFFGWVIGGSHPAGVAADWLTSAWGQNCGNHHAAPAAAAAEETAARWMLDILALPPTCSVGFVTGATVANFVCLAAARSEVLRSVGWDVEANGLFGAPPIRVLVADDAHTTVFLALQMLGLGHDRVVRIPTDEQGRQHTADFATALAAGTGPTIVITQAGHLNTGAFDPHAEIVPLAKTAGAWVHVDGAFGLWARCASDVAAQARGVDLADSWATDGHKWLQLPYDCGFAIVRNAAAHRRAMTAAASYLPVETEGERDPSHLTPELSRRARGFAAWAMIRHLGRDGISAMVSQHCALARRFAARLSNEPGIAIANDVTLNQVIVRFGSDRSPAEGDAATEAVIKLLQTGGTLFAGGARWRGQWVMRLSMIGYSTTEADVNASVEAIMAAWRHVRGRNDRAAS